MRNIFRKRDKIWLVAWLPLILTACLSDATPPPKIPSATIASSVRPFITTTPSQIPTPGVRLTSIPEPPAPSATPFTHTVVKDDTMLGIALKYGIKLEDLLSANPTVNPRILSIGTILTIPLPAAVDEPTPTITPLPLKTNAPICYQSLSQDLICLVEVINSLDQAVENLSVKFGLIDGNLIFNSQVSVPPLNILYPGKSVFVLANFAGPLPAFAQPHIELNTALLVAEDDTRYLPVQLESIRVTFLPDNLSAKISGSIRWMPDQPVPGILWVVANAYDAAGTPAGIRKLETRPSCFLDAANNSCLATDFELSVYSLGPEIQQIKLLVEARP